MQLMSWPIARMGSRFGFFFEPHKRRVMHGTLGRFLDRPMHLRVGLVEPDGTERILPFASDGKDLINCEQFERFNSITFRGYSPAAGVRFELNIHSPFYPQHEKLTILPAYFFEIRTTAVKHARWRRDTEAAQSVEVFFEIERIGTQVSCHDGEINLDYDSSLTMPRSDLRGTPRGDTFDPEKTVRCQERIESLNPGTRTTEKGLRLMMPVTEEGSGRKWRMIWGGFCGENIMQVGDEGEVFDARFRYTEHWQNLDEVMQAAREKRDDHLILSRRFEKTLQQAPLDTNQEHLVNMGFQAWSANAFWMSHEDPAVRSGQTMEGERKSWFSVLEGSRAYQSTLNAECNSSLFYLALWPDLLRIQLQNWLSATSTHAASGGVLAPHNLGGGLDCSAIVKRTSAPAEHNTDLLNLLHIYTRWTGDRTLARTHAQTIAALARYTAWTDRDESGFPNEGIPNYVHLPRYRLTPSQTYLAVKRLTALRAAADMIRLSDHEELAEYAHKLESTVDTDVIKVEQAAWRGNSYAPAVDPTLQPADRKAFAIYNINGQLLPMLTGGEPMFPRHHWREDIINSQRETLGRYGCSNSSQEQDHLRVSQNLWRDITAAYFGLHRMRACPPYWELQVISNTHVQSRGFTDGYIAENLAHYPRGLCAFGYFLAGPAITVDRLSSRKGGLHISVSPDRHNPGRWPLLPLTDWRAGKIPVCVVDNQGGVRIESPTDPVEVRDEEGAAMPGVIG